jgi:ClpP class serine protease
MPTQAPHETLLFRMVNEPATMHGFADRLRHPLDLVNGAAPRRAIKLTYLVVLGVATVHITGQITRKSLAPAWCGPDFDDIPSVIRSAIGDPGVRAVVLVVDSPGGSIRGPSRVLEAIASARAAGKPVIAHIDGSACGCAYAIAAACDRVYASPLAAIGALTTIVEIVAPPPAPGTPPPMLSATFIGVSVERQRDADLARLATLYAEQIAQARRVSVETVEQLGEVLGTAELAQQLGLVDDVIPFEAALDRVIRGDLPPPRAEGAASAD